MGWPGTVPPTVSSRAGTQPERRGGEKESKSPRGHQTAWEVIPGFEDVFP